MAAVKAGEEEAFVLTMDGPFEQKTGGKGANAAAAAGQTFACEFLGNMGAQSAKENAALTQQLQEERAMRQAREERERGNSALQSSQEATPPLVDAT